MQGPKRTFPEIQTQLNKILETVIKNFQSHQQLQTICVNGNIAAGKSTLIHTLQKYISSGQYKTDHNTNLNIIPHVLPEQINLWGNTLAKYYQATNKYIPSEEQISNLSYNDLIDIVQFQLMTLYTKILQYLQIDHISKIPPNTVHLYIVERTIQEHIDCFLKQVHKYFCLGDVPQEYQSQQEQLIQCVKESRPIEKLLDLFFGNNTSENNTSNNNIPEDISNKLLAPVLFKQHQNMSILLQKLFEPIFTIPIKLGENISPEHLCERIKRRAREGEDVSVEYLAELSQYYQTFNQSSDPKIKQMNIKTDYNIVFENTRQLLYLGGNPEIDVINKLKQLIPLIIKPIIISKLNELTENRLIISTNKSTLDNNTKLNRLTKEKIIQRIERNSSRYVGQQFSWFIPQLEMFVNTLENKLKALQYYYQQLPEISVNINLLLETIQKVNEQYPCDSSFFDFCQFFGYNSLQYLCEHNSVEFTQHFSKQEHQLEQFIKENNQKTIFQRKCITFDYNNVFNIYYSMKQFLIQLKYLLNIPYINYSYTDCIQFTKIDDNVIQFTILPDHARTTFFPNITQLFKVNEQEISQQIVASCRHFVLSNSEMNMIKYKYINTFVFRKSSNLLFCHILNQENKQEAARNKHETEVDDIDEILIIKQKVPKQIDDQFIREVRTPIHNVKQILKIYFSMCQKMYAYEKKYLDKDTRMDASNTRLLKMQHELILQVYNHYNTLRNMVIQQFNLESNFNMTIVNVNNRNLLDDFSQYILDNDNALLQIVQTFQLIENRKDFIQEIANLSKSIKITEKEFLRQIFSELIGFNSIAKPIMEEIIAKMENNILNSTFKIQYSK